PLTLNGVVYPKGIGGHAPADIRIAINGVCTALAAVVGVDDEVGANGAVIFPGLVHRVKKFDSGGMKGPSIFQSLYVDLTGGPELGLVITNGGDDNAYDHGDGADAQVSCGADTTAPTVTATSPVNGATGVAVGANVTATFSEAMNPATLTTTTVTLKQG